MQNTSTCFSDNLRLLRSRDKRSQGDLASTLGITRAKLNSYENGVAQNPPVQFLISLAVHFKVSIDTLLCVNLVKTSELKIRQLQDEYIKGGNLRVLATTIDKFNKENIELVPLKARAGYATGYSDVEFIASLPAFQLPFLAHERKYRAFQIEGDSMLPVKHGSYVIAEYVLNWEDIKSGQSYIVVTNNDGIVFKVVHNQIRQKQSLKLVSLNTFYQPYDVAIQEVKEVWKFVNYMSSELPEPASTQEQIMQKLITVEEKLSNLNPN